VGLLLLITIKITSHFTGVSAGLAVEVLQHHVGPLLDIVLRVYVINVGLKVPTKKFLVYSMLTVI
jgi:hypothetical protein